jgi:hypothetical protein
MTLLLRPQVEIGEGPRGYLAKLAEANCLSARELGGVVVAFDPDTLRGQHCAPSLGAKPDLDDYLEVVGANLARSPGAWVRRNARYCPQCLKDSPKWRVGWELLFADSCPIHGVWLIDICSGCRKPITWRRARLLRCDCGRPLVEQTPAASPTAVVRLSKVLTDKLTGKTTGHALGPIEGLDVGQLQRLIRFLGGYADPEHGPLPQKVSNIDRISVSWRLVSLAAELLAHWPNSLHTVLDRLQRTHAADGGGRLGGRFGWFYSALYRGFPEREFAPLRDAFENYLAEHWRGALGQRNRRLPAAILERAAWIPANHACRQLGVSRRRLKQLISEDKITGETRIGVTGRTVIVVRREDVARQLQQLDQEVDLIAAAGILGLTKRRMQTLMARLFPEAYRSAGVGTPWAVPRTRLDTLTGIADRLPHVSAIGDGLIAFGHILRFWAWTDAAVAGALSAVMSKTLMPVGVLSNVSSVPALLFREADLRDWHASTQLPASGMLTVPQVADRIGIKQEVAYSLVRSGLLISRPIDHGMKRGAAGVSPAALEAFGNRYRFARDLATSVGCSPRALIGRLGLLGVEPVSGPGVDGCRQVIYENTEKLQRVIGKL